jgi:ribulose-5-phosphate 4-epimerase/fuculose-1-phosphate aldolase
VTGAHAETRTELARICRRLYERDMVTSTGGNVSARADGGEILISPTGRSLADLAPDEFVSVGPGGRLEGGRPSKELAFHRAVYERQPGAGAVVHGHCAVAIAVAGGLTPDDRDAFPAYTAGYVMRVGRLPVLPYFPSGSPALAEAVGRAIGPDGRAVLLQNHGFVTAGPSLDAAFNTAEELIDALKVFVFSGGRAPALPGDARDALARGQRHIGQEAGS